MTNHNHTVTQSNHKPNRNPKVQNSDVVVDGRAVANYVYAYGKAPTSADGRPFGLAHMANSCVGGRGGLSLASPLRRVNLTLTLAVFPMLWCRGRKLREDMGEGGQCFKGSGST